MILSSVTGTRLARAHRFRTTVAVATCTVGLCVGLTACSGSPSGTAAVAGSAVHQTCTAVTDVLQNGPDPDADPVGYAEAQPLPLSKISTGDAKLKSAIRGLASAYRSFADSNGSKAAKVEVKAASRTLNAICPGAAS